MNVARQLQKIRDNEESLKSLRVGPFFPSPPLTNSLLRNQTIKQMIFSGNVNYMQDLTAFAKLMESLTHLPLMTLDLSAMKLGEQHIELVASLVRQLPVLRRLDLSVNNLSTKVAALLGESFKGHPTLSFVDLSQTNLGDAGCKALLSAWTSEGCAAMRLNVSHCGITAESAGILCDFMRANKNLTSVTLNGNFLQNSITRDIADIGLANLARRREAGSVVEKKVARPAAAADPVAASPSSSLDFLMKTEMLSFPSLRILQTVLMSDK
jgi:Leucine-rich repeat (LRR) protein